MFFYIWELLFFWKRFRDNRLNCGIRSIFSFRNPYGDRISDFSLNKRYCGEKGIIGLSIGDDLESVLILGQNPYLRFVFDFFYNLVSNLSITMYNRFELASLYEFGFWCVVLRNRIHRSIWSEHSFSSKYSFYNFLVSARIVRESGSIKVFEFFFKFGIITHSCENLFRGNDGFLRTIEKILDSHKLLWFEHICVFIR